MTTIFPNWALGPAAVNYLFPLGKVYVDPQKAMLLSAIVGAGLGVLSVRTSLSATENTLKSASQTILNRSWEGVKIAMVTSAVINVSNAIFDALQQE